jgi:hypothetical protein
VQPDSITASLHQVYVMYSDFTVQQQHLSEKQGRLKSAIIAPVHLMTDLENEKNSDATMSAD